MRQLGIVWIVCCLAIGLSACATLPPPSHPEPAKACAEWRWIGISQPEAPCPEVAGWTVRPLFPQLSPVRQPSGDYCPQPDLGKGPSLDVIRELNRFCVYEIRDSRKKRKDLALPSVASAGLVRLDQDCAALSLTAAETDETWKPEPPDFFERVGQLPRLPTDHRPTVRLAFLDTQPTGDRIPQVSGNSPHGYTLAHIARQMICTPDGGDHCAAQITTRLSLPIIKFDAKNPEQNEIDPVHGGYLGMQSDLATAIFEEVRTWRQEGSQKHLILNLSMAWDGELFGGLDEERTAELRAGSQAVYNALQYAAESGVLVLAAAGNLKRDPCPSFGPLLPAAWEREAPRAICGSNAQLLYAIGGVQADGTRLNNARPGGMPRRVAYGEAAIFSGSSVSTAVASSIAAVVWNAFPELSAQQLMATLDGSGQPLFPADFWFSNTPNNNLNNNQALMARQLTLCEALAKACADHDPKQTLPICDSGNLSCGSGNSGSFLKPPIPSAKPAEKVVWKGSCQPWLFPQPEAPIRPCPKVGECSDTF